MVAYLVATVRISDPVRYAAYTSGIVGLAEKHGGEPVVKGLVEEILEGEVSAGERVVVTRFPNAEAVRSYIASAQYEAAKAHRIGASELIMRLVPG